LTSRERRAGPDPGPPTAPRSIRIVVVSADPVLLGRIREDLADSTLTAAFQVTGTSNVAAVLDGLKAERPDVMIVDARMDGSRTPDVWAALNGPPRVPVVLIGESADASAFPPGIVDQLSVDEVSSRALVSSIRHAAARNRPDRSRQESEEALQRAESELRAVVRHAGVMTCRHDLSGVLLEVSDSAASALGFDPAELVGVGIRDILAPGRRPEFDAYLARIRAEGAATGYMALVARSGETRVWHYQNRLLPVEEGFQVDGMAIDATERLRAEGAAATFSRRQAAILDALPAQVALVDEQGTILEVNEEWNRFALENGGEPSRVGPGTNYLSACGREGPMRGAEGEDVAEGIRAVLRGESERFTKDYECDAPDRRRWFRVTVTPVTGGKVRGAVVMHVDRTEQRSAEARLQHQALIFENMHDAVMIVDREGTITDWNRAAERMYGILRDQAIGANLTIVAPTMQEQERSVAVARGALEGKSWQGERPFRRPDGSTGIRELVVVPLKDSAGRTLGTAGISRDVTDARAAAAALAVSEERYREVIDHSPMGFYRSSRDGRFLAANLAFARMLGYESVDALLSLATAQQLYASPSERELRIAENAGRDRAEFDLQARRQDGTEAWMHLTARHIVGPSGGAEVFEAFVSDVTAERVARRELQERTRALESLLSKNPLAIVFFDPERRVLSVNPAFERLFGYSEGEVAGRRIDLLLAPEEEHADAEGLMTRLIAGEFIQETRARRRKDGVAVPVEIRGVPIFEGATLVGSYVIIQDISERLRAEESLRDAAVRLDAVINAVADPIFVQDREHRWTLLNDAFCAQIGRPREALIGQPASQVLPRRVAPEETANPDTGIPAVREKEETITDAEGRERSVVIRETVYRDKAENEFAVGVMRDVTERNASESALRRSEERYRLLFERNLAGVYRAAIAGKILDCNWAYAEILGYTVEELRGKDANEVYFYETDRATLVERLAEAHQATDREFCLRRKDGSRAWVIESVSLVESEHEGVFLEGCVVDISARREVEDALRESEERYRFLFERNPLPMWIYEIDTLRFTDVNMAAILHYGFSRAEFLSMSLAEIRPPEDRPALAQQVAVSAPTPQTFLPSRHWRRDGSILYAEVSAVDLPGPGVRRRMALARDVTERLRAEAALSASEEKYRMIIDLAPIGIYQSTIDGRIITCNESFARIFGWPSAAEMRREGTVLDLYDSPEERARTLERMSRGESAENMELHLRRRDGSKVWVQLRAQMFRDDRGEVDRMEGFVIDISDRKRVEEQQSKLQTAVLETARQWRDTFDAIATPVLIVDAQGIVRRLNRAIVEHSGRTYLDLLGKPLSAVGAGEPWRRTEGIIAEMGRDGNRTTICRDAATDRTWEVSVTSFENSTRGDVLFIVVARDITTLVELQESVLRSESMAAMGTLVAGVAHEVRNPLFAISATLDAFDLRFRGREEHTRYATALRSQLDRMNELMHGLLDLGKPSVYDIRDVPIEGVVAEALRSCGERAAQGKVRVESEVAPDLPLARIDRTRMVQVFVNLIENAIQHAPSGSTVRIRVGIGAEEDTLVCAVEDSGPGFRPEDMPRLFEPFFTRRQGGTGLGLAIVRRLVTEQGGEIAPENRAEGGARMRMTLPSAKTKTIPAEGGLP